MFSSPLFPSACVAPHSFFFVSPSGGGALVERVFVIPAYRSTKLYGISQSDTIAISRTFLQKYGSLGGGRGWTEMLADLNSI